MTKKLYILALVVLAVLLTTSVAAADQPTRFDAQGVESGWATTQTGCTTIQSGSLKASDGSVIAMGYDKWGYNYQAHMFNGFYCDAYRNSAWCQPWATNQLMMKWNDAWLSNVDCNGDGLLDRHTGYPSYIGSGAWLTNHERGEYPGAAGQVCRYEYFTKIIAAPAGATLVNQTWYAADGTAIGPVIWGEFATIQEVNNDPCGGAHGLSYRSPDHTGFGGW